MFRKILKFFLYTLLILALAAGIALLVVIKNWPWWVGAALGAGILGLFFAFLFLKRYLMRHRERKFVQQVIAQDSQAIDQAPRHERRQLQEMQEKWKASVDLLRQSNLKKQGNPLYVLPWYLVLGEAGSGKTTAIKNAKVNSPVSEVSAGIGGTRNFDWWFFDEAIILDTAGRYSIPIDQEPDREEWERFLTLLAKYRKKEPLNGAILTVSADSLLNHSADALRENGLNLRKRIDQLMRVCGARFPVYLMVTKTDRVHGFNPFSQLLPEDRLNQAMGCSSPETTGYWQDFLDTAHRFVCDRLKDLRLLIIQHTSRLDPGVLLFPDEFDKLHSGLTAFAEGVFQENPYQETPMLAGLYYSSGKQEGAPCSDFMNSFDITCTPPANPRNGIFLRDFFKKILPGDRHLFVPILEYFKWRRLTRRFGLAAWCLLCLFLLGLVSLSYIKNTEAIEKIARNAQKPPAFSNDTATDVLMLNAYGRQLEQIRKYNRNWRIPRFGFDQSLAVEERFVAPYVESFRSHFLKPMDARLEKNISQFDQSTPDEAIADYAAHIVARIRVLQNYLQGRKPKSPESETSPASPASTGSPGSGDMLRAVSSEIWLVMDATILNDIALQFGRSYYRFLELSDDPQAMRRKSKTLRELLVRLLEAKGMNQDWKSVNLNWLTAKKMPGVSAIALDDYWGEIQPPPRDDGHALLANTVPAAYTRAGKAHITEFLKHMEEVLGSSLRLSRAEKAFWQRYENDYLQAWANFALSFGKTPQYLASRVHRKKLAESMTTESNPYFNLLSEMADQLQTISHPPGWTATLIDIEEIRNTRTETEKGQASMLDRIRDKGSAAVGSTLSVTSPEAAQKREKRLRSAKQWQDYLTALGKLQPVANRPQTAYKMAGAFFRPDGGGSGKTSKFHAAQDQISPLITQLRTKGDPSVAEGLLQGPLDYLANFATRQAERVVQQKWESMVLADTRGMDPAKIAYTIFKRPRGAVWKFVNGPAKPFINQGKDGFYAASALGQSMAFKNDFFMFLDQGAAGTVDVASSYSVRISALPIQVNAGAQASPYAVSLNLSCADGQTQLKNYNFRETQQFKWRMNQCGDVELTILLPDTRLTYAYKGSMGFAKFLKDFRDGVRTYRPRDFPEQSRLLKNWDISGIRVAYEIENAEPVIRLLTDVPRDVPDTIMAQR